MPRVKQLREFLMLVSDDQYACFLVELIGALLWSVMVSYNVTYMRGVYEQRQAVYLRV